MLGIRFQKISPEVPNPDLAPFPNSGSAATERASMALECHGLAKSFGQVQAVREFDLSVPELGNGADCFASLAMTKGWQFTHPLVGRPGLVLLVYPYYFYK